MRRLNKYILVCVACNGFACNLHELPLCRQAHVTDCAAGIA